MIFRLVAVGRPREPLAAAVREYEQRAARYWPLETAEVREEPARGATAETVREREAERLLERVPDAGRIVACDEGGRTMKSTEFAAWMQKEREAGRDVAFVIGGAFGLAPALRAKASLALALAPWTLPHELARLVLAEQIYRAGTLVRGEPYHK